MTAGAITTVILQQSKNQKIKTVKKKPSKFDKIFFPEFPKKKK